MIYYRNQANRWSDIQVYELIQVCRQNNLVIAGNILVWWFQLCPPNLIPCQILRLYKYLYEVWGTDEFFSVELFYQITDVSAVILCTTKHTSRNNNGCVCVWGGGGGRGSFPSKQYLVFPKRCLELLGPYSLSNLPHSPTLRAKNPIDETLKY